MMRPRLDLRRLSGVFGLLFDERVGIVRHLDVIPREPGAPEFFEFGARACNTGAFSREKNFAKTGGASLERTIAAAKAVGEAVERYCGALFDVEELPLTSRRAAPFPCVEPGEFALYSPSQLAQPGFLWVPFDEDTPVRWVPALDLCSGKTCHVPAAMVYVPYFYYQGMGEAPIVQPISTGLACHMSLAEAACSAICEVIERDAVTLTWQARMSPPHVLVETLSAANRALVRRFESTGDSVFVLDITLDGGVPTYLAVLRGGAPERAALVIAGAAEPDPERAVCKSLEELEHTRRYSQYMKSCVPRLASDPTFGNIVDQPSHLNFWCDPENTHLADFLTASRERVDFRERKSLVTGDAKRDVQVLVNRVRATGHRVLVVDVTSEDVRQLGMEVGPAALGGSRADGTPGSPRGARRAECAAPLSVSSRTPGMGPGRGSEMTREESKP
jgi:ribosomal protein S12 methylthiotransferase accessory factor